MLKHLTLSALFYCFLFAFQLVVFPFVAFYVAKGIVLHCKTLPFASRNVAFCKPKDYVSAASCLFLVMRLRISC